jgi:hypothetical protein
MKVFIVSQAGKVADVTLQSSCHSEDESVLKVRHTDLPIFFRCPKLWKFVLIAICYSVILLF